MVGRAMGLEEVVQSPASEIADILDSLEHIGHEPCPYSWLVPLFLATIRNAGPSVCKLKHPDVPREYAVELLVEVSLELRVVLNNGKFASDFCIGSYSRR